MTRLGIISSHPIQYNAPLFKLLAQRSDFDVKVFFSWKGTKDQADPEFGKKIVWDIPLLEGYDYCFVENKSKEPGTHHFMGLDNPSMIDEIEAWDAEAILVYGWASKTHLNVLKHFKGRIPIFFRGDSTLLTQGNYIKRTLRKIWLRWVYKHIDIAFYPGKYSKEYFKTYGLSDSQLKHVPHSIDDSRFSKNDHLLEEQAKAKRHSMGIGENDIVFLFAGKLVPRKNPAMLLQAFLELQGEMKSKIAYLVFVGTGPLEDELKEAAKNNDNVKFLGFVNQKDMPITYRLGDVYVLPSNIETWGLGVNEAMASSRPAIVSDSVGCSADLIEINQTGDIFETDNYEAFKSALSKYLSDKEKLRQMGHNAKTLIKDWSIEASASSIGQHINNYMLARVVA